jgi:putative ABC transport system ATP-binding protein
MTNMQPAVAVRELTKIYSEGAAGVPALRGIDLSIHPGEMVMLIGPSGSGKTTLLSIMGCILSPTGGSVQIAGKEVSNLSQKSLAGIRLEHIGFVFQGFNLFPTLTAGENVELMLDLKGIRGTSARARAQSLLEQVGIGEKYDTFPADLSGGQKQRVAIARALAGEPDILLADEPTAALDSQTGRNVMEMVSELAHQDGRAVVIVTHDLRLLEFADRSVSIEDGLIATHESHARVPAVVTPPPASATAAGVLHA